MEYQFNTVEEALEELRAGHLILTIDDPDRENEGDLICAAQFATTENVNFMATHAKGLICTPMSEQVALRLGLEQMVKVNTGQPPHRVHGLHRPCGHHDRHFRRGTRLYLPQMCGYPHQAGGAAPSGTRFPACCTPRRCADPQRPHRGNCRSVPSGRTRAVRSVL